MVAFDTHLSASCFFHLTIHLAGHSTLGHKEHSYFFFFQLDTLPSFGYNIIYLTNFLLMGILVGYYLF